MIHFIKKYYIILIIIVSISSYAIYIAVNLLVVNYSLENDPRFNNMASGPVDVSVFMGNKSDTVRCDSLAQVKRGVPEGDLKNGALISLFKGASFSEETVLQSAFKGYDQIYNGLTADGGVVFVDFKSDLIDPNSVFFKDFTKVCAVSQ